MADAVTFLEAGQSERVKLAWHVALLAGCAGAALYNAAAWLQRKEDHLALNAALYGAGTIIEAVQVSRHWE